MENTWFILRAYIICKTFINQYFYWVILLGKIIKYNCPKYKYNAISILGNIYKTGKIHVYGLL